MSVLELEPATHAAIEESPVCNLEILPEHLWLSAAAQAVAINPLNAPNVHMLERAFGSHAVSAPHLALLTTKYWGSGGVRLSVGFLDNPPADLAARILSHMNAWSRTANVSFVLTSGTAQVRILRTPGIGFSSFLGTDILSIPAAQPTMKLANFTMATAESEYHRVIRHETGHTLGFPHEHARAEIVNRIDRDKAIAFFGASPNFWSPATVTEQVLTALDNSALQATARPDASSIMCYSLPASIMKDNIAVPGGGDIDFNDASFAASVYPRPGQSSKAAPSLTPFGNNLWAGFVANNNTNTLLACSSSDGLAWAGNVSLAQASKFAPSFTPFNGHLQAAFVANNNSNTLLVCSSADGIHWTGNTSLNQASKTAPSLAVFNGHLFAAFVANNDSNTLLVCSSADGVHWSGNTSLNQASHAAPSLAVFNGRLWVAFLANNNSNTVLICSSNDGVHWTNNTSLNQASKTAPSLAVFNGKLWVSFIANNNSDTVLVCSSADGTHWTNNTALGETSPNAPSITAYAGRLWVSFTANNNSNALLVSSSPDGVTWARNLIA